MARVAPALADWMGDPVRREATRARRGALVREWREGMPIAALADDLDALVDPSAEAVAARIRPLLEEAGWLDAIVAKLAGAVAEDPFLDPPLVPVYGPVQTGLVLYQGRHAMVFAGVAAYDRIAAKRRGPRTGIISFTGTLGLMRVLRAGGARLSMWEGGWRDGLVRERCNPNGLHDLCDGEVLTIDGRTTAFIVEQLKTDMVLLQATIHAGGAATSCEYDVVTRDLVATVASRDAASRTQMLATLLASLDTVDAEAFDTASRITEPFARWHAMRCWLATDAESAAPRLAEMSRGDPDAEIRALAIQALRLCPA